MECDLQVYFLADQSVHATFIETRMLSVHRELSVGGAANLHNYAAFIDWKCIFVANVAFGPPEGINLGGSVSTHSTIIALLEYHIYLDVLCWATQYSQNGR